MEVVSNREATMVIKEAAMEADSSNSMAGATRADMEEEIKADTEEDSKGDSNNMEVEAKEEAMTTNKVVDMARASNTMVGKDTTVGATSHKVATMAAVEALAEVMI